MLKWKEERNGETALLIEGARRIGKSTIVEEYAKAIKKKTKRRPTTPQLWSYRSPLYKKLKPKVLLIMAAR